MFFFFVVDFVFEFFSDCVVCESVDGSYCSGIEDIVKCSYGGVVFDFDLWCS